MSTIESITQDDLYWQDILAWSQRQAELLRRLARGERVDGVDWEHVIEEIEEVGSSELNSVCSLLRQGMVHLLKVYAWPDEPARNHWRIELTGFLQDAQQRFSPSMRQKIDLEGLWRKAVAQVSQVELSGRKPRPLPAECPFSLDDLLSAEREPLEAALTRPT